VVENTPNYLTGTFQNSKVRSLSSQKHRGTEGRSTGSSWSLALYKHVRGDSKKKCLKTRISGREGLVNGGRLPPEINQLQVSAEVELPKSQLRVPRF
jgi:hypothetical protein